MVLTAQAMAIFLLFAAAALGQTSAPQITTRDLPKAVRGFSYRAVLQAQGGASPLAWTAVSGLPAGVGLSATGELTGTPTAAGVFRVRIAVRDSSRPPLNSERELILRVVLPLEVEWKQPAQARDGGIFGSVHLVNNTPEALDVTVIVVAVNTTGKAFALGYQHTTLSANSEVAEMQFGFTLPQDSYVVHADAVGESAAKGTIYRSRLQTPALQVQAP